MDRLQQFYIFTEVAKRQSFSEVANQLDLPRSTVTSAIQQLETHYGYAYFIVLPVKSVLLKMANEYCQNAKTCCLIMNN